MAISIKLKYHTHTQMYTHHVRVHTYAQDLWTSLCVSLFFWNYISMAYGMD